MSATDKNINSDKNFNQGLNWERQTLEKLLLEDITERRRTRRWGIFFRLIFIIFLVAILLVAVSAFEKELPQPVMTNQDHTAYIDVRGDIDEQQNASADNIRSGLKSAFEAKHVKGIILRINSPGGSAVQARQVYDDIVYFRSKYPNIKVYAAIEDMGASAAYLIAAAADSIYADKASIVGSIGVKIDSFGFVDGMHKLGIERRLYTAGKYKDVLDPFTPRKPEEDAFIKETLQLVHRAFIENVVKGRGNRLKDDPNIFSGQFWCGDQAFDLGLIDGFGDANYIAREVIKAESMVDYTATSNLFDRLASRLGASVAKTLMSSGYTGVSSNSAGTGISGVR